MQRKPVFDRSSRAYPRQRRRGRATRSSHRSSFALKTLFYSLVAGAGLTAYLVLSPWPIVASLKHLGAAPNCAMARMMDLAPAKRGQPGYWSRLDADDDGIACEPWPR